MRTYFFSTFSFISMLLSAQSEDENIRRTIQKYIDGSSYNNSEMIQEAFYEEANLFLSHKEKALWIVPIRTYASWFEKKEKGKFNGRTGKIRAVDVSNDIATAKAEILISGSDVRYIDVFILKKLKGTWKIISKAATSEPLK